VLVKTDSAPSIGGFVLWMLVGLIYARLAEIYHWKTPPLLWFYAGLAVGLAFHEGGHALCALLTGRPIRRVSIGVGPLLLDRQFGVAKLEWRLLPFAGIVQCYPEFAHRRLLPTMLFILGGVLGNAILASIVVALVSTGATPPSAHAALIAIGIAQVVLIAINLFPHRVSIGGTRIGSDGLQLFRLFWRPHNDWARQREAYAAELGRYSSTGEVAPIDAPHSARIFYQVYRPDRWADEGTRREFQSALIHELNRGELWRQEEMLVLDALLTYGLVIDDPELRPRLDEWSLRALALGPDVPTLLGTRGAVLVSLGRYEEGKALLSSLPGNHDNAPSDATFDTFMNQVFLAQAELALGNSTVAQSLVDAARKTAKAIGVFPAMPLLLARFEFEKQHPPVSSGRLARWYRRAVRGA